MGALHAGHAALVKHAAQQHDRAVVSVFVNPKQFGPTEDLAKYPRTLAADVSVCAAAGAAVVYAPTVAEMYPEGFSTNIQPGPLAEVLCGAYRPGHFDGVCTVVLLLLNLVQADAAYFGMKDFQQLAIIRHMCRDLAHPTDIRGFPTIREPDGLALSSRNRYLDAAARTAAAALPKALAAAAQSYLAGEADAQGILARARAVLEGAGLDPQYLELRDAASLAERSGALGTEGEAVLAAALFVANADGHRTRLIDNIVLSRAPFNVELLEELCARACGSHKD